MLQANDKIAQFKVLRKLGEGGMGEVYLAEDTKLNRQVALKTLRDDYFDNIDRRDRFEREAKTAAQIQHPNIMAIYDIGTTPHSDGQADIHYIVMEYVRGEHLTDYLPRHADDTARLLRISEKIAGGLAAAHKLNIVHRDIKPENIIIDEDDEPKILDFGLAKPLTPLEGAPDQATRAVSGETMKANLTKVGTVIGTVAYMSPEQARGETVDSRSDIFSFGVLLYRTFTGQMPFTGQSQVSILAKILETAHPAPKSIKTDIDPEIERIIDKCLQKNADDRYQDTRDLVIDLRNLRRQYDSGISTTTSGVRASKEFQQQVKAEVSRQRRKRIMIVLPLIVIILAASYLIFDRQEGGITSSAQAGAYTLAIMSFENKTGDPQLDWLETGLPEILLTDLAQGQTINVISQRKILEQLGKTERDLASLSYEEQVRAARKLGAVSVMSGTIFKLGDKFRIDARLEDVKSGKILMGEKVIGEDPFKVVDSLTTRIAASLNLAEFASLDRGVAQLTTGSPEAYRLYHEGMSKFSRELWDDAMADFRRAVALDTAFGMAYMRMGMIEMFRGRTNDGIAQFAQAQQFAANMPDRDRQYLDIYSDLWFRREIDDAFRKLQALVEKDSGDLEAKSLYGMLKWEIGRDTSTALALLDDVLERNPKFSMALACKASVYTAVKRYDDAVDVYRQFIDSYPESPTGYRGLASIYTMQGNIERAQTAYEDFLKRFPGDAAALGFLIANAFRQRDFTAAASYIDQLDREHQDDPIQRQQAEIHRANLSWWNGHFQEAIGHLKSAVAFAQETRDSNRVFNAYNQVATAFERIGRSDSAIANMWRGFEMPEPMIKINVAIRVVSVSPRMADSLRPLVDASVADVRSRMPKEVQAILDRIIPLFDGYAQGDTGKLIAVFEELEKRGGTSGDIETEIGKLAVLSGRYESGRERLRRFLYDGAVPSVGYIYLSSLYYYGRAEEALGNPDTAQKSYAEVLRYWDKADIQIDIIKDSRARLAKLRS